MIVETRYVLWYVCGYSLLASFSNKEREETTASHIYKKRQHIINKKQTWWVEERSAHLRTVWRVTSGEQETGEKVRSDEEHGEMI